ncbi:hypothetical protein QYE76_014778 [Lolium multiflorum]|uniref:Protein kinase domain-containing protein n=1 Tax=Lolium multiflorum TaxID=4521 RepID=A0AAD8U348_LOLMU|nr:hypothetical protein QYE76_014778 [Lolium multiflorum]
MLLDGDMEAHLGNFGLANAVTENSNGGMYRTESASFFAGSYGLNGTEKTDVYNTGVVLMDLVTGHLPTDRTFRVQRRHGHGAVGASAARGLVAEFLMWLSGAPSRR